MKLSDVKGARAFDVLEKLPELLQPIIDDPESAALFTDRKKPKGMSNVEFGYQWLHGAIEKLMVPHRKDFIKIMSTINGVDEGEYLNETSLGKMTDDVMGLFVDDAFTALFFSASQKTATFSGSVTKNTAESEK